MLPTVDHLLGAIAQRRRAISSVRGFARVAYASGGKTMTARHAVVAERPGHLRLEVLGPLGAIALLVSDGDDMALYVRRENRVYRGPASAESIAAYAAVPVPVDDIVSVLLGMVPERAATGPATVTSDSGVGSLRLTVPFAEGRQEIWFHPTSLAPVASETPLADGSMLRVEYGDLRKVGAVDFPFMIDLRAQPGDRAITVRYTDPALNRDLAPDLFAIAMRPGIEEHALSTYSAEISSQ